MQAGKLFLIPVPIHDEGADTIPESTLQVIKAIDYFLAERSKTARKFIKLLHPQCVQADLTVDEMTDAFDTLPYIDLLKKGRSIGVMSEAGNPCIADPGHKMVAACHVAGIDVVPLTRPSSILLAMIASGFNGQQFTFHGYLPNKKDALVSRLKLLEQAMFKTGYTQIFMETPYRNHFIWEGMLSAFSDKTLLCMAANLGGPEVVVKTRTVGSWKKSEAPDLQKIPAIFMIGQTS